MRRRNNKAQRDQDLALALFRIEAAFGPVQVLEAHPNPRSASHRPDEQQAREGTGQTALDLDGQQHTEGGGGEAVA